MDQPLVCRSFEGKYLELLHKEILLSGKVGFGFGSTELEVVWQTEATSQIGPVFTIFVALVVYVYIASTSNLRSLPSSKGCFDSAAGLGLQFVHFLSIQWKNKR
jgi:hypothetical protein